MAEPDNLVVATKVRKEFGGLVATNDVDFTIPRGSIVSLIGPNGAGKTTFFNQLTGVYKPTSGSIVFDGDDVWHYGWLQPKDGGESANLLTPTIGDPHTMIPESKAFMANVRKLAVAKPPAKKG